MNIQPGNFVGLRGRRWLVEEVEADAGPLNFVRLSCISDDAQGEPLEVLWDAEIEPEVLDDSGWARIGHGAPDSPDVLAAHLRPCAGIPRPPPNAIFFRRRFALASGSNPISFFRFVRLSASPG